MATEENDLVRVGIKGPVKEVYTERIEFDHEKDTSKKIPGTRIQYNKAGFIMLELIYDNYGNVSSRIEYIYDSNNRVKNKKTYHKGSLSSDYTITYMDDGSRHEETYAWDNVFKTMYLYESAGYSPAGKLLNLKRFDSKDKPDFDFSTTRTDTGETIIKVKRYLYGNTTEIQKVQFNADGLLGEKSSSSSGNMKALQITYNDSLQIKQVVFMSRYRTATHWTWEYIYNTGKKLLRINKYATERKIISRRNFAYKDNELYREECITYDKQQKPLYSWIYLYDHQNNIVKEQYRHLVKNFTYTRYREKSDTYTSENLYNNELFYISGFEKSYYPDGRTVLEVSYGEGKIIIDRSRYKYLNELLMKYIFYDTYKRQNKTTLYEYNSFNDLTKTETYREDDILLTRENYNLEYDIGGNWIRKTLFRTDNAREMYNRKDIIYTREISYYED